VDLDPVGVDDDVIDHALEQQPAAGGVELVDALGDDELAEGDGSAMPGGVADDLGVPGRGVLEGGTQPVLLGAERSVLLLELRAGDAVGQVEVEQLGTLALDAGELPVEVGLDGGGQCVCRRRELRPVVAAEMVAPDAVQVPAAMPQMIVGAEGFAVDEGPRGPRRGRAVAHAVNLALEQASPEPPAGPLRRQLR